MSKITITRHELLELWNGLPGLVDLRGFNLGYAVGRTRAKLRPQVEALAEAIKPDKDFQAYTEKRLGLCHKFSQKDDQGQPMISGGQFIFREHRETFEAEMIPLNREYNEAIEARKKQIEEYNSCLKTDIEVEIFPISEADIPGDPGPTVEQMEVLFRFIKIG